MASVNRFEDAYGRWVRRVPEGIMCPDCRRVFVTMRDHAGHIPCAQAFPVIDPSMLSEPSTGPEAQNSAAALSSKMGWDGVRYVKDGHMFVEYSPLKFDALGAVKSEWPHGYVPTLVPK